jgi:hypothetical protein
MLNVYTVQDKVSNTYRPPVVFLTDRDARDAFQMLANDEGSTINKYPEDFQLLKIGSYDERSGLLSPLIEKESICWAKELLTNNEEGA